MSTAAQKVRHASRHGKGPSGESEFGTVPRRVTLTVHAPVVHHAAMSEVGRGSLAALACLALLAPLSCEKRSESVTADAAVTSASASASVVAPAASGDAFDAMVLRLETDPSIEVRKDLCAKLYATGGVRAIPAFAKVLGAAETQPALRGACFEGLVAAWVGGMQRSTPNREAYELTLKILEQEPRGTAWPPAEGVGITLLGVREGEKGNEAWDQAVGMWLDAARLREVLERIALDAATQEHAALLAVDALQRQDPGKARFVRMTKTCEKQGASCTKTDAYRALKTAAAGQPIP